MIYDCIMFNDEIDLLKMHIEILKDVIDRFIIVEGTHTFQGERKYDVMFLEHQKYFQSLGRKVWYYIYDKNPDSNPWVNEYNQRNSAYLGLISAAPNDTVLISDVDEIADPDILREYRGRFTKPHVLDMKVYYYYVDLQMKPEITSSRCVVITPYSHIKTMQKSRDQRLSLPTIKAGWHFSYLGGPKTIAKKLNEFAHAEYNNQYRKNLDRLSECLKEKRDLFDRPQVQFDLVPVEYPNQPRWLIENKDKFPQWFYPKEQHEQQV